MGEKVLNYICMETSRFALSAGAAASLSRYNHLPIQIITVLTIGRMGTGL